MKRSALPGEGHAGVIVDGDMQGLPTRIFLSPAAAAIAAPRDLLEAGHTHCMVCSSGNNQTRARTTSLYTETNSRDAHLSQHTSTTVLRTLKRSPDHDSISIQASASNRKLVVYRRPTLYVLPDRIRTRYSPVGQDWISSTCALLTTTDR